MTEKVYSRVTEAEDMIKALCEKYPKVLWTVRPQMVAVYGIENKERSESNSVLAKIKPIKGIEKTIMQDNNISIRWIIDLFWSDWREWNEAKRQWVLFHELLHIHSEVGKSVKHDLETFRIIVDKIGVLEYNSENLPNLLLTNVEFNMDLRPKIEEEEEKDEISEEEVEEKKKKRMKKAVAEIMGEDAPEETKDKEEKEEDKGEEGDLF